MHQQLRLSEILARSRADGLAAEPDLSTADQAQFSLLCKDACLSLGVPLIVDFDNRADSGTRAPTEILQQLEGRVLGPGLTVNYRNEEWIVVTILAVNVYTFDALTPGEIIPNGFIPETLSIVPRRFIDCDI